jgi:hypothetical protein
MRWTDRLSTAGRVVIVIAAGLALAVVADYLTSLGTKFGWYAYSPLARQVAFSSASGEPGWLRAVIWLAAISLWAALSAAVLRHSPDRSARK